MLVLLQNMAVTKQAGVSGSSVHVGAVGPRSAKLIEVDSHECAFSWQSSMFCHVRLHSCMLVELQTGLQLHA